MAEKNVKNTISMGKPNGKGKTAEPILIQDNVFTGVHWDAQATEAIVIVAHALLNLTELFKAQNITIEAMLAIDRGNSEAAEA